jgi:hypothetical protein
MINRRVLGAVTFEGKMIATCRWSTRAERAAAGREVCGEGRAVADSARVTVQ